MKCQFPALRRYTRGLLLFVKPDRRKFKPRKSMVVAVGVLLLAGGSATVAGVASADAGDCTAQRTGTADSNRSNIHRDPVKDTEYVEHWCDVFRSADVVTHRDWNPDMEVLGQLPRGRHWFMCQEQWTDEPNKPTWNNPAPADRQNRPTRVSTSGDRPTRVTEATSESGAAERTGKRNDNDWWLLAKATVTSSERPTNVDSLDSFGWVPATHIRQGGPGESIPGVPLCNSAEASTEVREARAKAAPAGSTATADRDERPTRVNNERPAGRADERPSQVSNSRPQAQQGTTSRTPASSGETLSDGTPKVLESDDPRINDPIPVGETRIIKIQ